MSELKITMENPQAYQTRDGKPAEIVYISNDAAVVQPVIAKVTDDGRNVLIPYSINGFYFTHGAECDYDLILKPITQKYKVILFKSENTYYTMTCDDDQEYKQFSSSALYFQDLTDWIEYTP